MARALSGPFLDRDGHSVNSSGPVNGPLRALHSDLDFPRDALRRIVEERFLRDALAFPALVGEFLHVRDRSVEPFEVEYPADDNPVDIHEYRLQDRDYRLPL